MANVVITPTMITNKAVLLLENLLNFGKFCNKEYSDQFAREGAKIGAVLNVRKPARYIGRSGPTLVIEDQTETYVPLVITNQFGVDVQFSSQELTLNLQDFSERVLHPNMATVANKVDRDGCLLYSVTPNEVGTPGSPPANLNAVMQVRQRLLEQAAPDDNDLYLLLGPDANTSLISGNSVLFNPQGPISAQYKEGIHANVAGLQLAVDQNIAVHTVGPLGGSPTTNGAGQGMNNGWAYSMNLLTKGWTASGPRLNQGDVFTIAGVFWVNPQTRQSTGKLAQFVVLANVASDGSGNATVPVLPALIYGGQYQNVTNSPPDAAPITVAGTAGVGYPKNIGFHKSAYTLATVDLVLPRGVDMAERKVYKNISLRIVRAFDINNDRFPARSDVLYGYKAIYAELGVRLTG